MTYLEGMIVIDATTYVSGPLAGMALADLGADVVKVEPPSGDPFRRFGPIVNGVSPSFVACNRGKRSIVVDLQDEVGRSTFDELLRHADVLLTNWRPGVAEAFGLDGDLIERFPRLIWVRLSGFGPDGPAATSPVFDAVIQARSGLADAQGEGGKPQLVRSWVADKLSAAFATQVVLASLVERERRGCGTITDVPMLDAVAYFNFPDLFTTRLRVDAVEGPKHNLQLLATRLSPTADGWIVICPVQGRQIRRALEVLGVPELAKELKATSAAADLVQQFYDIAESRTRERPTSEWLEAFSANDVPVAPVYDVDQHLNDEQVSHNGVYGEVEDVALGRVRYARYPALRGRDRGASWPAPFLDQHRDEIRHLASSRDHEEALR